jgi:hypothetical protein
VRICLLLLATLAAASRLPAAEAERPSLSTIDAAVTADTIAWFKDGATARGHVVVTIKHVNPPAPVNHPAAPPPAQPKANTGGQRLYDLVLNGKVHVVVTQNRRVVAGIESGETVIDATCESAVVKQATVNPHPAQPAQSPPPAAPPTPPAKPATPPAKIESVVKLETDVDHLRFAAATETLQLVNDNDQAVVAHYTNDTTTTAADGKVSADQDKVEMTGRKLLEVHLGDEVKEPEWPAPAQGA